MAVRHESRTKDLPEMSKRVRNKKCFILDCIGSDEEGYEYLIEVGKFDTVRTWVPDYYLDL